MAIQLMEQRIPGRLREQISTERQRLRMARRAWWERGVAGAGAEERIAKGLGWFSIGLGLAELVAPGPLSTLIGVRKRPALMRSYGVRELAAGIGILAQRRPAGWLWARVAGDAVDLTTLGMALGSKRSAKGRVAITTASVAAVTTADVYCAVKVSRGTLDWLREPARAANSLIINRSPEEVYSYWRDFRNLPRFMQHLSFVQVLGDRRSHWVARVPGGRTIEWDAEITEEEPNRSIAWRSLAGADIENRGRVRFEPAPGGRGTILHLELHYHAPGGAAGALLAKIFEAGPGRLIQEDLRRFKQVIETGEVATNEGPSGPRTGVFSRLAQALSI